MANLCLMSLQPTSQPTEWNNQFARTKLLCRLMIVKTASLVFPCER